MRKSNRIRSKLLPGLTDISDDLPAPSTTRPLLPRSRAVSLARSGLRSASTHGSSRSNSSRSSLAMDEHSRDTDVVVSGSVEPVAGPSSSLLNMDGVNEAGGSLPTSLLKRKRSGPDIVAQEGSHATTFGDSDNSDSLSSSSLKGKGKAKELHLQSPGSPVTITILDTPEKEASDQKGKNKVLDAEPKPRKPKEELLGGYSCPICFSPPSNATLTPCGHICCGLCLFVAVKTTMQRANLMMAPEGAIPRCPVCRATIPGWDGKGGGVIGLKARAILTL